MAGVPREPLPRGGRDAHRHGARHSFGARVRSLSARRRDIRAHSVFPLPAAEGRAVARAHRAAGFGRRAEDRAHCDYRVLPSARNRARRIEERARAEHSLYALTWREQD